MEEFMTIRKELAYAIAYWKKEYKLTYDEMIIKTGLNKTQLVRIIKNKGDGVSIDLMEKVCIDLGYAVILEVL